MKKRYLGLFACLFSMAVFAQPTFEWADAIGSAKWDGISSVVLDDQGYSYTTGYFYETVDFDPGVGVHNITSSLSADIFIRKLDSHGNLVWVITLGGGYDQGQKITMDENGDLIITGIFSGTCDFDPGVGVSNLTSSKSSFVLKLDSDGNFIWVKGFNEGHGRPYGINTDNLGNIFIVGQVQDTADFDPGPGIHLLSTTGVSDYDAYVLKLDPNGDFLWAHSFGDDTYLSGDASGSIDTDTLGNVYLTGRFEGTVDFDPGPSVYNLVAPGTPDKTFILKLDSAGSFVWAKTLEAASGNIGNSLCLSDDGYLYVAGGYNDATDFDPGTGTHFIIGATPVGYCGYLLKLDVNGEFVWVRTAQGMGVSEFYNIDIDNYGNVYSTGWFTDTVNFNSNGGTTNLISEGDTDIFIQKHDASGNFIWAEGMGGLDDDGGISIQVDNFDNIYIGGINWDTTDANPDPIAVHQLPYKGNSDGFLVKLSQCTPATSTDVITTCDNAAYTWIDGNSYSSSNNTAVHTIIGGSASGCDSIVYLDLNFLGSTGTDVVHKCNSYTWIDGNTYVTSNNTATHTLTNAVGCDSTVTLDLTIGYTNTGTDTQESCGPFTWIDGITYTTDNNTATHTVTNSSGCDSTVTLYLTIYEVNTNYTTADGTITADASGATYQWIDCTTNAPIVGETLQSFTPTVNGSYAVIVTENNCTDTSSCVGVENVGMNNEYLVSQVSIYPNPAEELVTMELGKLQDVTLKVFDVNGKLVYSKANINTSQYQFKLSEAPGVYFIEVSAQGGLQRFKLMKQ